MSPKAATKDLLILDPPVDKSRMSTTTSCWKDLDLDLASMVFVFIPEANERKTQKRGHIYLYLWKTSDWDGKQSKLCFSNAAVDTPGYMWSHSVQIWLLGNINLKNIYRACRKGAEYEELLYVDFP